jgi:hypothetical protein
MRTNESKEQDIFIVTLDGNVVGIRVDRIVSFIYNAEPPVLTLKYLGDPTPERFEGPMAEALLRELRYTGRN